MLLLVFTLIFTGCRQVSDDLSINQPTSESTKQSEVIVKSEPIEETTPVIESEPVESTTSSSFDNGSYTEVSADSCSLSGGRVANAKVDVGYDSDYANREYWAYQMTMDN